MPASITLLRSHGTGHAPAGGDGASSRRDAIQCVRTSSSFKKKRFIQLKRGGLGQVYSHVLKDRDQLYHEN